MLTSGPPEVRLLRPSEVTGLLELPMWMFKSQEMVTVSGWRETQ